MKQECIKWVEDAKITGFKGSDGWFNGSLTRHIFKGINIHGESDDFMDE